MFRLAITAASAVAVMSQLVVAQQTRTLHCGDVWKDNSTSNDMADCVTNTDHLQTLATQPDFLGWLIFMAFPILFFLIALLCCPVFTIGRYVCGCCGSHRRRPDHFCCGGAEEWDNATDEAKAAAYPRSSIRNTKCMSVFVLFFAVGCLVLCLNGTTYANFSYVQFFVELKELLSWLDEQALGIRTLVTINETGELIPPLTPDLFNSIQSVTNGFRKQLDDMKGQADPYVETVNLAALIMACVPLIFLVVTVLCAVLDLRTCILCINLIFHWLMVLPYSILAFAFLAIALALGTICGERAVFLSDPYQPGLMAYGLVPFCAKNAPFDAIKDDVSNTVRENSIKSCENMINICDESPTMKSTFDPHVFYCPWLIHFGPDSCTTLALATAYISNSTLKPNIATSCWHNVNDSSTAYGADEKCTLRDCANDCTNKYTRDFAKKASQALDWANSGWQAYERYMLPLLSCTELYTQALRPLNVCPQLTLAFELSGGGLFGFSFLFLVGMCVICRGQKRFFKPPPEDEETESDVDTDSEEENEPFADNKKDGKKEKKDKKKDKKSKSEDKKEEGK